MDQIPSTHSEQDAGEDRPIENNEVENIPPSQGNLRRLWGKILEAGLGETTLRIGTGIVSIILILVVVWVMSNFFLKSSRSQAESLTGTVTPTPPISLPASGGDFAISTAVTPEFAGVSRLVNLHTNLPSHPRDSVMPYTVAKGDTLFDIADKFGLKPESLFWSNRYILGDNPDNLIPGLVINIPPQDGAIYQWNTGDGLNGVAKYYKVTVDAIIDCRETISTAIPWVIIPSPISLPVHSFSSRTARLNSPTGCPTSHAAVRRTPGYAGLAIVEPSTKVPLEAAASFTPRAIPGFRDTTGLHPFTTPLTSVERWAFPSMRQTPVWWCIRAGTTTVTVT